MSAGGPARLSLRELESYRGQGRGKRAGKYLRYFCPIHGSDHQRSLALDPETGRFKCFACGAWGYLEEKRWEWVEQHKNYIPRRPLEASISPQNSGDMGKCIGTEKKALLEPSGASEGPRPRPDLEGLLREFQAALPGSLGEKYLEKRGIPLELARACGTGYAAPGRWPHRSRDWKQGRLVFPHTDPEGRVVNLYGRAAEIDEEAPKELRHDHLPGPRGIFNAKALASDTVFVCEGVFDALSLMAAGYPDAVAIFGVNGLRWEWVTARRVVFCLDRDAAGGKWRELAWEGVLRGKEVYFLPEQVYSGCKDLNEAWIATGRLDVGGWEAEGGPLAAAPEPGAPAPESAGGEPSPARPWGDVELLPRPSECPFCRGDGQNFWPTRYGWWACLRCHPPGPAELEAGMVFLRSAGAGGAAEPPLELDEARRLIEETRRRLWRGMPPSLRRIIDPRPEMMCDVSARPIWEWMSAVRPDLMAEVCGAISAWREGLAGVAQGAGADRMRLAAQMVEAAWRRVFEAWEAGRAEEERCRAG